MESKRILWIGFGSDEGKNTYDTKSIEVVPISSKEDSRIISNNDAIIVKKIKESLSNHYCKFYKFITDVPSVLYDFDIILIHLPNLSISLGEVRELKRRREEIEILLRASKFIVCILDTPEQLKDYNELTFTNYSWLPFGDYLMIYLHEARGTTLLVNTNSEIGKMFEWLTNFNFLWLADLRIIPPPYYLWDSFEVIAANNAGLPVSFLITLKKEYGGGKVLFLPQLAESEPEKIKGFYVQLINSVLKLFKAPTPSSQTLSELPTPTPEWITDFKCFGEDKIKNEKERLEQLLQEFHQVKRILYEKGKRLVEPVALVFKKLGFEVKVTEELGIEDIEINFENQKGLIEVKSIESEKRKIDKFDVCQIITHLMKHPPEEREKIKCILVVNWDVSKPPKERRECKTIFTRDALSLAENANVCLLSTYTLWEIYNRILEKGEEEAKKIREKILNTNGMFTLE